MALNITRCKQCGQSDDHPKVIVSDGEVYHHDCVNADLKAAMVAANPDVAQIITTCEGGVKGDDLRAYIQSLPTTVGA